jgi:hypothetical protein
MNRTTTHVLSLLVVVSIACFAPRANSQVTYVYHGSTINGFVTVPSLLEPGAYNTTLGTLKPTTFSFTSGSETISPSNCDPLLCGIGFVIDQNGRIPAWLIEVRQTYVPSSSEEPWIFADAQETAFLPSNCTFDPVGTAGTTRGYEFVGDVLFPNPPYAQGCDLIASSDTPGSWSLSCQIDLCSNTPSTSADGCINLQFGNATGWGKQYVHASFLAPQGKTLTDYAHSCGFSKFDWQQQITYMPCPSDVKAHPGAVPKSNLCGDPPNDWLTVSNGAPPIDDSPQGGYTEPQIYATDNYNPWPFYYPVSDLSPGYLCAVPFGRSYCPPYGSGPFIFPDIVNSLNTILSFVDAPSNPCLRDSQGNPSPSAAKGCRGQSVPPNVPSIQTFSTSLVGIDNSGSPVQPPLYTWTWASTFNGTAGDAFQTISLNPIDPGSGIGGVTPTNLNGVPQTPPSITCALDADDHHFRREVTVAGAVTSGTRPLATNGTTYSIVNKCGEVESTHALTLNPGGTYSFEVPLRRIVDKARMHEKDCRRRDGEYRRKFTIVVQTMDDIGNEGTCSVDVNLFHDEPDEDNN